MAQPLGFLGTIHWLLVAHASPKIIGAAFICVLADSVS
jgi:hypothetical protein